MTHRQLCHILWSLAASLLLALVVHVPASAQDGGTRAAVMLPSAAGSSAAMRARAQAELFFVSRLTSTGRFTIVADQEVQRALQAAAEDTGASPAAIRQAQLQNAQQGLADVAVQLVLDGAEGGWLLSVSVFDPLTGRVIHADNEPVDDREVDVAARAAADTLARRWLTSPAAVRLFGGGNSFAGGAALSIFDIQPSAVRVFVNGQHAGLAPGQFAGLPEGPVTLSLEADGYATLQRELTLSAGQMTDLRSLRLQPLRVPLTVRADHGGATILIDGTHVGETVADEDVTVDVELSARTLRVVATGRRPFAAMLALSAANGARVEFSMPEAAGPDGQNIETADCTVVGAQDRTRRCLIPSGEAVMGSDSEDAPADARPSRPVTLSRPFLMHRNEVTVRDYFLCVDAGACAVPGTTAGVETNSTNPSCNTGHPQRGDHPMNCVTAEAALEYCEWAGGTLPSEAQWERAARGTDGRLVPWSLDSDGVAGHSDVCRYVSSAECAASAAGSAPVGETPDGRSPYGLNDMLGNVAEWTADAYESDAYAVLSSVDPVSTVGASRRVVRGSSWASLHRSDALISRSRLAPQSTLSWVGFRCVFTPER